MRRRARLTSALAEASRDSAATLTDLLVREDEARRANQRLQRSDVRPCRATKDYVKQSDVSGRVYGGRRTDDSAPPQGGTMSPLIRTTTARTGHAADGLGCSLAVSDASQLAGPNQEVDSAVLCAASVSYCPCRLSGPPRTPRSSFVLLRHPFTTRAPMTDRARRSLTSGSAATCRDHPCAPRSAPARSHSR